MWEREIPSDPRAEPFGRQREGFLDEESREEPLRLAGRLHGYRVDSNFDSVQRLVSGDSTTGRVGAGIINIGLAVSLIGVTAFVVVH